MTTPYHSQYWAHSLSLKGTGGEIENLSRSLANARVDLNPHQIDAALFALRSPLSNGVILADEVGLGKTIEAGIVLAQRWAERRRRMLIIAPAMLRKQWQIELKEKFFLPSLVLDSKVYSRLLREGNPEPFNQIDKIVICSYHFASARSNEVSRIPWHLATIDEAHRLRNVFRSRNKKDPLARKSMSHKIADALRHAPKLLLTATPLQNSLLELYGLVSVLDDHVFGDYASFREQFVQRSSIASRNGELKRRLSPICTRTLRKQVMEYVPFTKRVPLTQEFLPTDAEHQLYESVSSYLQRDSLFALPSGQRHLITLVLRKLLSSSTFAIAHTLRRLVNRLENLESERALVGDDDYEGIDELGEERGESGTIDREWLRDIDPNAIKDELNELKNYAELAADIQENAKGEALVPALQTAFERAQEIGAARKAVIFTESRRTQDYLFELLSSAGYRGQLVMINGSNNDPLSREIYQRWLKTHEGKSVVSGSKAVDLKAALVEYFRNEATILIATEAAAEGVNLQFASLVVNYDLPWNPQRVEQRIGRCHRYGQKHDVVVLNFLNRRNEADQRVFQLLSEKFCLFEGVFGVSDELLGALESGVDLERRISRVYQECRTSAEIRFAFDTLQTELDTQIQARLTETRKNLMEHLDEDVRSRLRTSQQKTLETLSLRERWLLNLTRTELNGLASFDSKLPRFHYSGKDASQGWYNLDWKQAEVKGEFFYRQDHPLAVPIIEKSIGRRLPLAELRLNYSQYQSKISLLGPLVGQSGWLELSILTVEALGIDEFLVFAARTDGGRKLDEEICRKLLLIPGLAVNASTGAPDLSEYRNQEIQAKLDRIDQRNGEIFDEEVLKLDRWSEDLKLGLEQELKELDKEIRETRKSAALAQLLSEKLEKQKTTRNLERTRNTKRRELFEAQDAIDERREGLISDIEKQLQQKLTERRIFSVRWSIE